MGLNETRTPGPRPEQPATVRVEIGELVLDGFGHATDPDVVSAAFQTELTRLVHTRGIPLAEDGTDRVLDVLTQLAPLPRTASSARIGQALAQAVHAGLSGQGREPGASDHPRGRR